MMDKCTLHSEYSKLKWRCRRGMKELDVLLIRYLEQSYEQAPIAEQQTFQALLELPDMELYAYLLGQKTPTDGKLRALVEKAIS
jgi:antitoxin CptB